MHNIKIARGHEVKYWSVHKDERYDRPKKILELFGMEVFNKNNNNIVADVGCGPLCGIFHVYSSKYMYAIDPLWKDYKKNNLDHIPNNVITIDAYADTFKLPQLADLIISVNSLDHSRNIKNSILNIMSNLKKDGIFHLHVHMRTKKQLNKAHKMLIREKELDNIFSAYDILTKKIYSYCPIALSAPYKSYVVSVRKNIKI